MAQAATSIKDVVEDLFDRDERRSCDRYLTEVPVTFRARGNGRVEEARSVDIAERGLCVHASEPVENGTELELEVEVIMPTRVRLGFDMDALVIDGPSVSHFVRVPGIVRRCQQMSNGVWSLGVEFAHGAPTHDLRIVDLYLDHLREDGHDQFG